MEGSTRGGVEGAWPPRMALAAALAAAALVVVDVMHTRIPDHQEVVAVLVEAARTGQDVQGVVAARGFSPRAWGRAMLREGTSERLATDVAAALCPWPARSPPGTMASPAPGPKASGEVRR